MAATTSTTAVLKPVKKDKNQNIQVAVRCRALDSNEKKQGAYSILEASTERREVSIRERMASTATQKTFSFDKVFDAKTKQIELYKSIVVPILEEVLMGYNCTVFAYGQTGSGKTYTMEGERSADPNISWEEDPLSGIIPRAMSQLFSRLQKQECEFTVRVSYLEIYNEELIDLLGADSVDNPRLKIYEDTVKKGACIIQGLEEVIVNSKDQVYQILQQGKAKRQTAATLMNAHSSRSHSLFMVTIHIKENSVDGEELLKTGKLNLVDLAGSECIGRSGAVDKRAREAGNINQSLLTLGRVITALVEHAPHVPYRESKLTRLLQDSLGGRTKTSIIATVSPASCNLEETLSTLEYACRAKNITNKPEINQKLTKKELLKEYTEEIERMRKDLQASRDKNGIFMAEENYHAIQVQLAQQKDMLREQEEKLSVLISEKIKLEELFSDTSKELEERTADLQERTEQLEQTTVSLQDTQVKLGLTTQQRDEQTYLVKEHSRIENKLHTQATELLETADESTRDVFGLHDKLDRKRNVESTNATIQQNFLSSFHGSIDSMSNALKLFAQEQLITNSTICQQIEELVKKKESDMKFITEGLDGLSHGVVEGLQQINLGLDRHSHGIQKDLDAIVGQTNKNRDTEICRQFEFNEKVVITGIQSILASINRFTGDLSTLAELIKQQMTEQQDKIKAFTLGQQQLLAEHSNLVSSYADQHIISLQQQQQQTRDMVSSYNGVTEKMKQELTENFTKMLEEAFNRQSKHIAGCTDQMVASLCDAEKLTVDYKSNAMSGVMQVIESCVTGERALVSCTTSHAAQLTSCVENLASAAELTNSDISDLGDELNAFSIKTQEICKSDAATLCNSMERQKGLVNAAMQTFRDDKQGLESRTTRVVKQLNSDEQSHHDALITGLTDHIIVVQKYSGQVDEILRCSQSDIEDRLKDVTKFINQDLLVDIPTGETPVRRDFTYPRTLSKTGRHSILLADFRSTYVLNEAINRPIPSDDSEDSEDLLGIVDSKKRSDSTLSLVDGVDGDGRHDTSGDSALSSASAHSSSTASDRIKKANKENMNCFNKKAAGGTSGMKAPVAKLPMKTKSAAATSTIQTLGQQNRGSQNALNTVGSAKSTPVKP